MTSRIAHTIAMLTLIALSWLFAIFAREAYQSLGVGWRGSLAWAGLMTIAFIFNQLQYAAETAIPSARRTPPARR